MKTSAVVLAAAVAVAHAQPGQVPGEDVPINCAQANANYCFGGDIILRCDENAIGTPGRCSANLAGYPPSGGTATCWESSEMAGDAACQKNCVVYADEPWTLTTNECEPSFSASSTLLEPTSVSFPNSTAAPPTTSCPTSSTIVTLTTTSKITEPVQPPYPNGTHPIPPAPPSPTGGPPHEPGTPPPPGEPGTPPGEPGTPPGEPGEPGEPSEPGEPGTPNPPQPSSPPPSVASFIYPVGNLAALVAMAAVFLI